MKKVLLSCLFLLTFAFAFAQTETTDGQEYLKERLITAKKQKDAVKILTEHFGVKEKDWKNEVKTLSEKLISKKLVFGESGVTDKTKWYSHLQQSVYERILNELSEGKTPQGVFNLAPKIQSFQIELGTISKEWVSPYDKEMRFSPENESGEWWHVVHEEQPVTSKEPRYTGVYTVKYQNGSYRVLTHEQVDIYRAVLYHYSYTINNGILSGKCEIELFFDLVNLNSAKPL